MAKTKIQWTDVTDNVIVVEEGGWYCEKLSPGCDHCYAERLNGTPFYGGNGLKYVRTEHGVPQLKLRTEILDGWKRQTKEKRHFVNSMTDTFASFVPELWIDEILWAACQAPKQTFQFLTKRPGRMLGVVGRFLKRRGLERLPDNIWLGCSVENQQWAENRRQAMYNLSYLAKTWVSYEPALGPVDWRDWYFIDWLVAGGESGPNARPVHPDWVRGAKNWTTWNGVAFFFKQWGEWFPCWYDEHQVCYGKPQFYDAGYWFCKLGKTKAGRILDGREWNEFPHQEVK